MSVDRDVWTCPRCNATVRGNSKRRREAQREHARKHNAPEQLSIPFPPQPPKRRR